MFFKKKTTPAPTAATELSVNLSKERTINLSKTAKQVINLYNLGGEKLAVYGVYDHSGSMRSYYKSGSVQQLAEKVLAIALNFDDDGEIPNLYFDSRAHEPFNVNLDNIGEALEANRPPRMGTTNYADAMHAVVKHYKATGTKNPAFVIFQTDGSPDSRLEAEKAICKYSNLPIFWQFIGFGNDSFTFLKKLDELDESKRAVDNAGFFAVQDVDSQAPEELFKNLVKEVPSWLEAIRAKGILGS